jgi:hypothetical protein
MLDLLRRLPRSVGRTNPWTCTQVREVVVGLGAPAVPALIQALGDSDWDVRAAAAGRWAACGSGRWANSATPKPCPRSSKHWGIASGMFAVRQRRRWANSATPKPCPRSSKHWGIAIGMFAVRQRRRWANRRPQAVPALIQALGDSEWDVRRAAAEALGKLGDPQAVPALIQALGDSGLGMFAVRQRRRWANSATPKPCPRSSKHWGIARSDVRRAAAEALGKLGDPQAVPALIQALGDSD